MQFLEYLFCLDGSSICRHIRRLDPILSDLEEIIIDSTEIQTQRLACYQRQYYYEKKKKHLLKANIMTDTLGKILSISKAVHGRIHNFKLQKQNGKLHQNVTVLADSEYQSLHKIHPKTILPHKRRRKCSLTPEE